MGSRSKIDNPHTGDGASPGFVFLLIWFLRKLVNQIDLNLSCPNCVFIWSAGRFLLEDWRKTPLMVEIKKAEPKKASNPPSAPSYGSNTRGRSFNSDNYGGFNGPYGGFDGGFGPGPYRTPGLSSRLSSAYGYGSGGGDFGGGYGNFGGTSLGGYRAEASLGYSGRYPPYGGGFGGGYGASGLGGYGRGGEGYGNYGASGYTSAYESGPGTSYGGAGGLYGRGGYTGSSRYHPYAR
ncbi:hypothetical protein D5086_003241 [Populus alba]|uniref:Uncharacterized protein n=1 Tax=Populus alba TaxID=43335 RepID=A0ACC4D3Z3_POPAL